MPLHRIFAICAGLVAMAPATVLASTVSIALTVAPSGPSYPDSSGAPAQTVAFTGRQTQILGVAQSFWQTVLTGFQGRDAAIAVTASMARIDGIGRTAAYAGPRTAEWIDGTEPVTGAAKRFLRPITGMMHFDAADFAEGTPWPQSEETFLAVAIHEFSHALGFGSLFPQDGLLDAAGKRYVGLAAVDAFNRTNGTAVTSILLDAGSGHWSECWVVEGKGRSCDNANAGASSALNDPDILTPIMPSGPAKISAASIAAFRDLGYDTINPFSALTFPKLPARAGTGNPQPPVMPAPVPLPAGGLLLLTGLGGLAIARRRR